MNLTNEIIGGLLLILLFGVTFLIRYAFIERNIIRLYPNAAFQNRRGSPKTSVDLSAETANRTANGTAVTLNPAAPHFSQTVCFQSRLTTAEVEVNFRNYFTSLYPNALHRLRTISPRITRVDELLCMLILLKQNNEEIAHLLGVSRSTVLKNRYRLRCKTAIAGRRRPGYRSTQPARPEEERHRRI